MSALSPKSDILAYPWNVCFAPKAVILSVRLASRQTKTAARWPPSPISKSADFYFSLTVIMCIVVLPTFFKE
jgi:hypothetical protein